MYPDNAKALVTVEAGGWAPLGPHACEYNEPQKREDSLFEAPTWLSTGPGERLPRTGRQPARCSVVWGLVARSCLFVLAAQNRNNHIETILFKSLLSPLALASYWLTLTS